jgi:hypothetical protein
MARGGPNDREADDKRTLLVLTPRLHARVPRGVAVAVGLCAVAFVGVLLVLLFLNPNVGLLANDTPGQARAIIAVALVLGLILLIPVVRGLRGR